MDTAELVREFKAHHDDVKTAVQKAGVKNDELDSRMLEMEQKMVRGHMVALTITAPDLGARRSPRPRNTNRWQARQTSEAVPLSE